MRGGVDEAERVEGAGHGWVGVCPTLHVAGRVRWEWGELKRAGAPPKPLDTQLQGGSPEIWLLQAPGAPSPELAPWPCSPEDPPRPRIWQERCECVYEHQTLKPPRKPGPQPPAGTRSVQVAGCLLPRSQVPREPEQGLEDETPSGSLVHRWPRGGPCAHPILGPRWGWSPQGQRTPLRDASSLPTSLCLQGPGPCPLPRPAPPPPPRADPLALLLTKTPQARRRWEPRRHQARRGKAGRSGGAGSSLGQPRSLHAPRTGRSVPSSVTASLRAPCRAQRWDRAGLSVLASAPR